MSDILNQIAAARRSVMDHRFHEAAAQASAVLSHLPACLSAFRILAPPVASWLTKS